MPRISTLTRTVALNGINVAALALGFLQQLAVVKSHGATEVTDFYFLLIILPQIVINLTTGITNNALLPFIVHRRERLGDNDEASLILYFDRRIRRIGYGLASAAFAVGLAEALLAPVWKSARLDISLMLVCAPFLILYGAVNSLYATELQSRRDYWPPLAAMLFAPFCGIVCGLILASFGVWPFVMGQAVGMISQHLWLRNRVRMSLAVATNQSLTLTHTEAKELRAKVVTLLVIGLGFQFLPFIERSVAQYAGTGSVAAIALGTRLGTSVTPVISSGAAMVMFTTFAELAAAGNSEQAAAGLVRFLARLQWLLTGLMLLSPFLLAKLLPLLLPNLPLRESILRVFPDYFLAGCIGATGLLTVGCYYSVFKDYRFQLYAIYLSLAVYALLLSSPLWTRAPFALRTISFADAAFSILADLGVTLYVALAVGRIIPWHFLASFAVLILAWIFVRSMF
jgi:peptidoglycan biosynthesis protein MviN/MurJ (putative lipid II flippase)